jgi:uncharacterized integral membrane protein (TIGR00698 family)
MFGFNKSMTKGILFVAIFALIATALSKISFFSNLGISPLVIGIVLGIIYANTLHHKAPANLQSGITFSAKKILRFAIVLYGFRLTFQDIATVGLEGFLASLTMLTTTLLLGSYLGVKFFKLEKDTAILTASGASVCGAAAVLATEPVLKANEAKVAVAVSMVVLFGTISMFLYPIMYEGFIKDATGFLHMNPSQFGIYVGSSVHEVAQVVAIPASIPNTPEVMAHNAVIVKMTRVLLIAPMLIILGLYLNFTSKDKSSKQKLTIPWFAVYFILVAAFNSFNLLPKSVVDIINIFDTFLLTMAMTALGMGTIFANFKTAGAGAFYSAFAMFIWLVVGGFVITKAITYLV